MPGPYMNTPQMNDASHLTNGLDRLGELSPEKSFLPPQQNRDLISQMRQAKSTNLSLKTPGVGRRDPLRVLPNGNPTKSEFTPLMKSVTKHNIARRLSSRRKSNVRTPDVLKESYMNGLTPGLPKFADNSQLQSEHTSSSAGIVNDFSSMPQNISSSAQSTPLAQLPARDAGDVLNDGNMMTLREQENIIDKIEKENFGLKMKIHFLEEALSKRGGEFNQAALKENTDLKVNRITMQRELHKFKKNIVQAERDAEVYRLQLEEYRERIKRKQADETIRLELERLHSQLRNKESEIEEYRGSLESQSVRENVQVDKLRDELSDLQAELREKDRQLDEKEDQIDSLKMSASQEGNVVEEVQQELESANEQIDELKRDLQRKIEEASEAKEEREEAIDEKRKAEEDLDELRDEMANKSFTTKGLSRQLEEKTNKLEDELHDLQERYASLQTEAEEISNNAKALQDRNRELEKEGATDLRTLRQNLEMTQQQRDTFERKLNTMTMQAESFEKDLQVKIDEKDLLQNRHDALTSESSQLQKDLTQAQRAVKELELALEEERRQSLQNDNSLRLQQREEIEQLTDQVDNLHRKINSEESQYGAEKEDWQFKQRSLEAARDKAEEKAMGLQRTVDKLQDAQGTSSGREGQLQEALESEKQRHLQEEKVLTRQIKELNEGLANKRNASDSNRNELNNAKEEVRISVREQAALREKVAELEDEIEVLQADIEQEHEFAQEIQRRSMDTTDVLVQRLKKEKQSLQEDAARINIDLQDAKRLLKLAEIERDELENRLEKASKSADDTFNVDQEKRDLKRTKQKQEKELTRLRQERDDLAQAKVALEDEIDAEIKRADKEEARLNDELDHLRAKQMSAGESRDRESSSTKGKIVRLETRIKELEALLDDQSKVMSPSTDVSEIKHDLLEARKNETAATKRETELKSSNRDLKMQINELEREMHSVRLAQYKAKSPSTSPSSSSSNELAQARKDLIDAKAELLELQSELRKTKKSARRSSIHDSSANDLERLLKSSRSETDKLEALVSEKEDLIDDLREQLRNSQSKMRDVQKASHELNKRDRQISELKAKLKLGHENNDDLNELSVKLSTRDREAMAMKTQLKQLRQDRSVANQKADDIEKDLESLQSKYENMLEKLTSGKHDTDEIRRKEIKGLIRELTWLKAKCRREERLRKDLAWSKKYMAQGEAMRIQCNQIDLRILREMGVESDKRRYEKPLQPINKFRAGVFAVIAAIRMSNMEEQWRDAKKIGDELRIFRSKQRSHPVGRHTIRDV